MNKRQIISGIVFVIVLVDIIGLTGSAELGTLSFGEYTVKAVAGLAIMGASMLIGSDLWEEMFPRKKKNRR